MRTLQFKLWMLLFVSSFTLVAQKIDIYNKSFNTNKNTTALLKLTGGTVNIESSDDDNFYVEYNIEFDNYSERKKKKIIDKVKIETQIINNHITLIDNSKFYHFGKLFPLFESMYKKDTTKIEIYEKKSKQNIIEELKESKVPISFYEEFIRNSTRHTEEEKEKLITRSNNRKKRSHNKNFIIKVPKNIQLTINAKNTIIKLNNNFENKLSVRLTRGKFMAKTINNKNNVLKVDDALFLVENINGGEISVNNVRKGLIGSLNNVNLLSEFSNLEIGEIDKNNKIKGFSNDILIHNFSNNFEKFDLDLDYSKVNFFKLINDYQLNAYGFNTIVNTENTIKKSAGAKSNTKEKFFTKEASGKGLFAGTINFNITHSFINIH